MRLNWKFWSGVAVFGLTVAAHIVDCRNHFVRYDDYDYVVKNFHLESGLSRKSAVWAFKAAGYASNWHPLTWLSHAADISLARALRLDWKLEGEGNRNLVKYKGSFSRLVHAENVLWHAVNAVLLYLFLLMLRKLFRRPGEDGEKPYEILFAAFFALLWSLHPLRVEVVAWASERKELLCVFFMLLTLMAHVRGHALAAGVLFLAALLAKPVAVSLPVLVFVYEWLCAKRSFRSAVGAVLPLVLISVFVCYLTMVSQVDGFKGAEDMSWRLKAVCVVEAPAVYLAQTFWPLGLTIDYLMPGWSSWPYFLAGLVILLVLFGGAFHYLVLRRSALASWHGALFFLAAAWCYVGLLPMIGIVKVGYEPHSDRYTYWIGCGVAACCYLLVVRLCRDVREAEPFLRTYRRNCTVAGLLLLLVLGALTIRQSLFWGTTVSLFSETVRRTRSPTFARGLADDYTVTGGKDGAKKGEEMLRDLLAERHDGMTRAILALHLASYADGVRPLSLIGDKETETAFHEARLLAQYAIDDGVCVHYAYAALGFADSRDGRYASAYRNMKRAMDLGYKSEIIPVDLDEWKRKAEAEESEKAGKEGGDDVQGK